MKDITDEKSIIYGGIAKVEFECDCGKWIQVWTGNSYFCDCGKEYCLGVRVYEVRK